jgi:surface polysaccharide O-acyltransferase-like enzyme
MEKKQYYASLDIFQFICSIFVVIIHVGTITEHPSFHFILKSMVCRIAVPFFFVNSAYFFRKKSSSQIKCWIQKFFKQYIFLSILYLPIGVFYFSQYTTLTSIKAVVLLGIGFFYSGVMYHLWYFPALLFALLLVTWLLNKFSYHFVFLLSLLFYLFGLGETYFGYLKDTYLGIMYHYFFSIFITTKNGLFFGLIFVVIGFYLQDLQEKKNFLLQYKLQIFLFSLVCFILEGMIIYTNPGIDKNFLFSLLPLSASLFALLLEQDVPFNYSSYLRTLGQNIYFYHLLPIVLVDFLLLNTNYLPERIGRIKLFLGITIPLILTSYSVSKHYFYLKFKSIFLINERN